MCSLIVTNIIHVLPGNVNIWNHETQTLVKTFEVCDLPVRAARFISRKNWVVTASVSVFEFYCEQLTRCKSIERFVATEFFVLFVSMSLILYVSK